MCYRERTNGHALTLTLRTGVRLPELFPVFLKAAHAQKVRCSAPMSEDVNRLGEKIHN